MLIVLLAGFLSYQRLGRGEDPDFTIKTMVVQVQGPGATIEDTVREVTDRVEKKLQETPHLDFLRSYTVAGRTTIFVNLLGSTRSNAVPDIWYQVRKEV